jgi:hypothetical protein
MQTPVYFTPANIYTDSSNMSSELTTGLKLAGNVYRELSEIPSYKAAYFYASNGE